MHLFCVKPTIHRFSTLAEFLSSFSVGQGDLLLTEQVLFRQYLEGRPLTCSVVIKDQYGLGEPKEEVIDAILRDIACLSIRRIIAMGGGSVIDIAKILCVKDAYPCRRVIEMQIPMELDKELIVLPTTCGTGSEVTFGGIVTMKDTGLKTGVLAPELSASHAVLIPELLTTLPRWVMVHCSVDALGHSMESFVSPVRGNEFARAAGSRSIRLLMDGYLHLLQRAPISRTAGAVPDCQLPRRHSRQQRGCRPSPRTGLPYRRAVQSLPRRDYLSVPHRGLLLL